MIESHLPKDDNTSNADIPETQDVFGLFYAKKPIAKKTIKLAYKAWVGRKFTNAVRGKKFKFSPSFQ